jgi:hypothetical protein
MHKAVVPCKRQHFKQFFRMLLTCIEELQLYTLHAASITGGVGGSKYVPKKQSFSTLMKTLKVATPGVKM